MLLLPALAFLSFPNNASAAECPAFPKLSFWGDLSHDSVQSYVDSKFDGDWGAYIERMGDISRGLKEIHDRGKSALVTLKDRKVVLEGGKLGNYILLSKTRLKIIRCLAEANDTAAIQNFATAAGGNDANTTPVSLNQINAANEYRTYLRLPGSLVAKLRKQAVRRSLVENQQVSVNDIITRTLKSEFGGAGE
ncbi:MAG: hypothetical protein O3A85_12680 [Proteobacteria bacterium]|nr:hypothetical protein [Pseudomonadota bacterium]